MRKKFLLYDGDCEWGCRIFFSFPLMYCRSFDRAFRSFEFGIILEKYYSNVQYFTSQMTKFVKAIEFLVTSAENSCDSDGKNNKSLSNGIGISSKSDNKRSEKL